jgi:hypothetical protein
MSTVRFIMKCEEYSVAIEFYDNIATKFAQSCNLEVIPMCPYKFIETFYAEQREGAVITLDKPWDSSMAINAMAVLVATSSLASQVEEIAISLSPVAFPAVGDVDAAESAFVERFRRQLAAQMRQEMASHWARVGLMIEAALEDELPGYA